ncbi:MAG: hypothetical protein CMJ83_09565 [Planctomycetes bacterium]|nr:hypothetical protein [Planctomycetota bacterium]
MQLKRNCRRDVTNWLRARQDVLQRCPRCRRGFIIRPGILITQRQEGRREEGEGRPRRRSRFIAGLGAVARPHRACDGTGIRIRERALERLTAAYLENATEFPGLPGPPMSWSEFRRYRADESIERRNKVRELRFRLAHVRRSAQVRTMSFEDGPDGLVFATVTTTVDPKRTRWVRLGRRWHVIGPQDEERLRQRGDAQ